MYNSSDVGKKGNIFGLPYSLEESNLVLLPVHLDVTASYGQGTSKAPDLILEASSQLDLSLLGIIKPWEMKMAMYDRIVIASQNEIHRGRVINIIKTLESGKKPETDQLKFINDFCAEIHNKVEEKADFFLNLNKLVGIVGGDHSSPMGLIKSLAKKQFFGILHIDAHMDLRNAYEGFHHSHASIMYNALSLSGVTSLTQVGIRDFCEEEEGYINNAEKDIHIFYDELIYRSKLDEKNWKLQCQNIIETLPDSVYISFDMDGLMASFCPNTGTPVPGGLSFNEVIFLFDQLVKSGRRIVGFDISEAGNQIWDANVAARILYRISILCGVSNGLLRFT